MRKSTMSRRKSGGTRTHDGKKLYKVLHVGNGKVGIWGKKHPAGITFGFYSDYEYKSLPKGAQPSRWYTAKGELCVCSNGFHIATDPREWDNGNSRFFEAEYKGDRIGPNGSYRSKLCCRSIRLLREVWLKPGTNKFTTTKPKVKANAKQS